MASQETSLLFCSNGNFLSLHPSSSSKRAISQTIASPPKSFLTQVSHGKIIFRCFDRRFVWSSSICDIHTWTQSYNSKTKQKKQTVIQKCTFSTYLTLFTSRFGTHFHLDSNSLPSASSLLIWKIRAPQQPWFCLHKGTEVVQGPTSRHHRRSGDEKRVSVGKMLTTNFYWNLGVYLHTYMYIYIYLFYMCIYLLYIYYIHNNINV